MSDRAVGVVFVLLCALAAGTLLLAAPAGASTVEVDTTVGFADQDGHVDATTTVGVPSGTTSLEVTVPAEADVHETEGFTRTGDRTYEWTRSTSDPSIGYTYPGDVTRPGGDRRIYAMTDDWGLVRTPNVGVRWSGVSAEVDRTHSVDGEGAAGPHITYLGPYEEHVRETDDQQFRFVVPAAAEMREEPEAVLDALEHASERLDLGIADPEVFVVAAPTAGVEWGATGVQRGDADLWVRDVERLDTANNIWVHEYLHTRQAYEPTDETAWTIEGMADYYAALVPYEEGRIGYDEFRDRMAAGTDARYDDVVLSDRSSWEGTEAHYDRGALVFGHLDRLLRTQADSSVDAVVAAINDDGELTQERFLEAIEAAGGTDVREDAERYTETADAPPLWSREEHTAAFGGPDLRYEFEGFSVSGPYRSATVDGPRLVPGETLEASVGVSNVGTQAGDYDAAFSVDGETVDRETGTLGPDESTTHAFTYEFDSTGEFDLGVGAASETVVVEAPADVEVLELSAEPTEVRMGETVTLRATVNATADRPVDAELAFEVGGETVVTERVRGGPGESVVETTTTFDAPGAHVVELRGHEATVTVVDETATPDGSDDGGLTPAHADGSGFGAPAAIAALVAGLFAFRRASR